MKKKDGILIIQKFRNSQKITVLLAISFFIILFLYILILALLHFNSISSNNLFGNKIAIIFNILKDFFLVIISIVGTTLLTSIIIEKNKKNTTDTELLANDIFASPEFYSNLTDDNKKKMFESLEKNYYNRFSIKQEIYTLFRKSLENIKYNYYYEECNISISYFPRETYTEKNIVRILKVRSYSDEAIITKFHLCGYSLSPVNLEQIDPFEFISLRIDGVEKYKDDIIVLNNNTENQLLNKCGYSSHYTVCLKDKITLTSSEDTIIRIEYISRVADNDNSMSFRVCVPCRRYILNFIAPENHKVRAHAFGAFDIASNSSNSVYDNVISVNFDSWLLPENGVTICCIPQDKN